MKYRTAWCNRQVSGQKDIMAKEYAEKFYKSKAWIKCRESFISNRISIDGGLCQHCHTNLGYIVHHIDYITPMNIKDVNITLNHDNLMWVCTECHNTIHKGRYIWGLFDENGQPIPEPMIKGR